MHPAGCHILSRAMAGETINKPNGPAGSISTVATAIGAEALAGLSRSGGGVTGSGAGAAGPGWESGYDPLFAGEQIVPERVREGATGEAGSGYHEAISP